MALALNDRVQQTGTANTTVSFTLSGSVTGFQSFAVVGNGNTTYYSAFDATGNWEVGIGTYVTGGTLNATTVSYTSTGETSGGNYAAGGQVLVINQIPTVGATGGSTAYLSFANAQWTGAILARGALIYLADGVTNPTVCVLDFGADKTSSSTFTVQFPAVTNTSAIIRIS